MTKHATLGGSSAHIWSNCTGSVVLLRDIKKEPPTPAMLAGTEAHSIAEIVLEDFLAHKVHGSDPDIRAHLTSTDDTMLEAAYLYRDLVWEKLLEQSITGKAYGLEECVVLHKKLSMWGYTDFWVAYKDDRAKRVLAMVDYKYGYRPVAATKSPQLAFYLVALREELEIEIDYAIGAIVQPRVPGGETYKETRFTAKQLDVWKKKFFTAAEKIYVQKKTTLKVGPYCEDCRANKICPEYGKHLSKKTSLALLDPNKELSKLPAPEKIPDEVLKNIILHKDELVAWAKGCVSYGIMRHVSGTPIEGLKAVEGVSRRRWPGEEAHVQIGKKLKKLGVEDPFKPPKTILKGIVEIEKALAKTSSVKDAKEVLSGFCVRSNPTITLVSENDPRPSVKNALDVLSVSDDDSDAIDL